MVDKIESAGETKKSLFAASVNTHFNDEMFRKKRSLLTEMSGKQMRSVLTRTFNTMVAGQRGQPRFVVDDRLFANIIRGMPQADNPKDKGHFHEVSAEFWFVLEGTIEYKIEGLETFNATQGDVVYVPKQLWHRAHHGGTGFSTRLAMNGYPDMLHNYQPTEDMR